jgi:hypothetical protein
MPLTPLRLLIALLALSSLVSAQQLFRNVTEEAGVHYLQNTPGSPGSGGFLAMCGGGAAGDVDGDGWVDIFVTAIHQAPRLFRNLGLNGHGVHRGFEDVLSTRLPGLTKGRWNGASFADVDGDGDLDLLLTGVFSARHHLWINDGAGFFSEEGLPRGLTLPGAPSHRGFSAAFGDYDRDGYLDLYVTEWGHLISSSPPAPSNSRLLRNRGASNPGYFEDVTVAAGVALEDSQPTGPGGSWQGVYSFTPHFADFDDDGWPDLAIAGDFQTSRMFWNNGDGTFLDGTLSAGVAGDENGMGAAVGDFDGDGNLDWFVTSIYDPINDCSSAACGWGSTGNRLYLGDGQRQFTDDTDSGVRDGGWGWGTTGIDFDNDGALDLAMTNGIRFDNMPAAAAFEHDVSKLWRRTSTGFDDVGLRAGIHDRGSGKGLIKLDYDRDGDQDLFIINNGGAPVLYRNDLDSEAHWLQVDLRSHGPNSRAIGARVKVWPSLNAASLVREQSASSNFLSQNETLLHFGLGATAVAPRVEIRWPGGATTVLSNVPAGQRLQVLEP